MPAERFVTGSGKTSAPLEVERPRRSGVVAGWVLSGLVIAFLVMDAGMKIAGLEVVTDTAAQMGWPADKGLWRALGVVLLACTALYAWPRSALLGAILLTGYLGGAIATHVRIASPLFTHILFGVYLALMLWGGLWLRSPALRALLPLSNERK